MADLEINPLQAPPLVGFKLSEAPTYDDMTRCVHCGLCLNFCPTYRETGRETESPRGRLYLMRAFAEGKIDGLSDSLYDHLDTCLQCRGCETACPSGVKYGHLVEMTLNEISQQREPVKQSRTEKILKQVVFRQLFPKPENLRRFALLTRVYQQTPLQSLTRRFGLLKLPMVKKLGLERLAVLEETMLPKISQPIFAPPAGNRVPARTEQKYRVAFFSGCVMSMAFAKVNEATVRVLTRNYCEVIIPESLNCCGALNVHNGDREYGKEMARHNIEVFEEAEQRFGKFDAIILNAAGCGAMLKDYGELLVNDPLFADRAKEFSRKVKDITEFLGGIEFNRNFGRLRKKVTYQDACHLAHGQKVRNQPRTLLKAIPGLELIEMRESDKCCGSAGVYNVTQYDLSMQILDSKMEYVAKTGANCIVTANPGCHLQLQLGVKRANYKHGEAEVVHLVELLDQAYLAAEE